MRTSLAPQFWQVFSTRRPVLKFSAWPRLTALTASIWLPSMTPTVDGASLRVTACWVAVTTTWRRRTVSRWLCATAINGNRDMTVKIIFFIYYYCYTINIPTIPERLEILEKLNCGD